MVFCMDFKRPTNLHEIFTLCKNYKHGDCANVLFSLTVSVLVSAMSKF